MLLQKLKELTWRISKNWIYYVANNNTKYYLIAQYLLGKLTNSRSSQKIQQSLMKCIKVQSWSGTKLINWDSSRQCKWIYLFKRLEIQLNINIIESTKRKIVRLIMLDQIKFVLLVYQKFIIFLNYVNLNHFRKK